MYGKPTSHGSFYQHMKFVIMDVIVIITKSHQKYFVCKHEISTAPISNIF